jgi:hypothetical protein
MMQSVASYGCYPGKTSAISAGSARLSFTNPLLRQAAAHLLAHEADVISRAPLSG